MLSDLKTITSPGELSQTELNRDGRDMGRAQGAEVAGVASSRFYFLWQCVRNEIRMRSRRLSTLVAVLAMMVLTWNMIADPASGVSLIVVENARVLYTSSALALGSATLLGFVLGLLGFYLVRGSMREDVRCGMSAVIASSRVGNWQFLLGRWCGGVGYMLLLIGAALAVILVLHVLRGDGTIRLSVYLQTYALVLLPMVFYSVSLAILFDSIPVLMGKSGDVLYFILWVAQTSILAQLSGGVQSAISLSFLFDFNGLSAAVLCFKTIVSGNNFALGGGTFDANLAPLTLPVYIWPAKLAAMRCLTALMALLPLLLATVFFHRYSPDRLKATRVVARRNLLDVLNVWSRPLSRQLAPLYLWAAQRPGWMGQVLAEVALSLNCSPLILLLIPAAMLAASLVPPDDLSAVLLWSAAAWGVFVSDFASRHMQAGILPLVECVNGGRDRAYVRTWLASVVVGLLMMGVVLLRLSASTPILAVVLLCGLLFLSSLASCLGTMTHTGRSFLSLFLVWLYISTQAPNIAQLDVLGFNRVATIWTGAMFVGFAVMTFLAGWAWNRRRS